MNLICRIFQSYWACAWINNRCRAGPIGRALCQFFMELLLSTDINTQADWLSTTDNKLADKNIEFDFSKPPRKQGAAAPLPPTLLTPNLNHAPPQVPPHVNSPTKLLPTRPTDHAYRDYSNYPVQHCPTNMKSSTNFPTQLHEILSTPEYSHVS